MTNAVGQVTGIISAGDVLEFRDEEFPRGLVVARDIAAPVNGSKKRQPCAYSGLKGMDPIVEITAIFGCLVLIAVSAQTVVGG